MGIIYYTQYTFIAEHNSYNSASCACSLVVHSETTPGSWAQHGSFIILMLVLLCMGKRARAGRGGTRGTPLNSGGAYLWRRGITYYDQSPKNLNKNQPNLDIPTYLM